MSLKYQISYQAVNTYQVPLKQAIWQFLIIPENNETQKIEHYHFENSASIPYEESIDGFHNKSLKLQTKQALREVTFTAVIELVKSEFNPFERIELTTSEEDIALLKSLKFRVTHEKYLSFTELTTIPKRFQELFLFDQKETIFNNLLELNKWSFGYFLFKTEVTTTESSIEEILVQKRGVCQDFTHVFCGLARLNNIPTRYVSGYLHQDNGLVGDLQMHAWVECFIPKTGWVGFDPTNNLLASSNHIKVTHGRDYTDCAPLKGVVYLSGKGQNATSYTVRVKTVDQFAAREPQSIRSQQMPLESVKAAKKNTSQAYLKWQQQQQQQQ